MNNKPLFSYTTNFFLNLDMARPSFRAQALHMAQAVENDPNLPAEFKARAAAVRAAALDFADKVVRSTAAGPETPFGRVRAEADDLLRLLLKRFVTPRYPNPKSAEFRRFLPAGLQEYNDADEPRYLTLFERFVRAMEAETKPFQDPDADPAAPKPAEQARQLLTRLQAVAAGSDEFEAEREQLQLDLSADWRRVAVAQWRLWLALAQHFAEAPDYRERIYAYVDFSEHNQSRSAPADSEEPADSVNPPA